MDLNHLRVEDELDRMFKEVKYIKIIWMGFQGAPHLILDQSSAVLEPSRILRLGQTLRTSEEGHRLCDLRSRCKVQQFGTRLFDNVCEVYDTQHL